MTNGQKLLEAFPNSKADTENYIWSVGFTVRVLNQAHTFIIDREWWNAECAETEDETAESEDEETSETEDETAESEDEEASETEDETTESEDASDDGQNT